jgi:hypothetical protein
VWPGRRFERARREHAAFTPLTVRAETDILRLQRMHPTHRGCIDHGRAVEDTGDARTQPDRPARDDAQGRRLDSEPPPARRILRADQAESVGWQQGEPFSFTQVPGCDDAEVAAIEGCDLADVEPFGEGDHAGVHHLQAQ